MVEAGAIANEVLARPEIETRMKSDRSPVSEADERVEEFLMEALERELLAELNFPDPYVEREIPS